MHPSSIENMIKCYQRYAAERIHCAESPVTVLDVGGANVNGNYSDIFNAPSVKYLGADIVAGDGVEVVLQDPYKFPLGDASVDFVISGQMLEHCEFFWLTFSEMVRVLKPDGYIFLIAPSAGPIHNYPVDCYRFYPDAFRALAKYASCHLVDVWNDERGPWNDLVGVFSKCPTSAVKTAGHRTKRVMPVQSFKEAGTEEEEQVAGKRPYRDVLSELHQILKPSAYLEIGVRNGGSLRLANCPALGIDPEPAVDGLLPPATEIFEKTSDEFFEEDAKAADFAPDMVFIDGMHLFEYALRDFMNVERICDPRAVIVVDDIFPNHASQARRSRTTRVWTGDVWRLLQCLQTHRPDLCLITLDTRPTGLLIIAGINAENRTLWSRYNPIVRVAQKGASEVPSGVIRRHGAISPDGEPYRAVLSMLHEFRSSPLPAAKAREQLRQGLRQLECTNG